MGGFRPHRGWPNEGPEGDSQNIGQATAPPPEGPPKIEAFDYLRAIVILLLLLHHGGIYRYSVLGVSVARFETLIEAFLLGGFVLLSGYLAAHSFDGSAGGRPGRFLRSRFWRIYPPYLVALLLFGTIVGVTANSGIWLAHVLGVQMLLVPVVTKVVKTVWFIGMIWLFFVLSAGVLNAWRRPVSLLAAFGVVYGLGWVVHLRWGWMDTRLLYFFPVFALAAVAARGKWLPRIMGTRFHHLEKFALTALAAALLLAFPEASKFATDNALAVGAYTFFVLTASVVALAVLRPLADRRIGYRWVSILSVSSFFIYLFHRPIWIALLEAFPQRSPNREFLFRMLVATPIVIAVSYALQAAYSFLLERWQGRRGQQRRADAGDIPRW